MLAFCLDEQYFERNFFYMMLKGSIDDFRIQISTSVLQEHITAVLMRYATAQKDRTTANVNLDILEMGRYAKVTLVGSLLYWLMYS